MIKLFKNKKAQNTVEYAMLFALVIAFLSAMSGWLTKFFGGMQKTAAMGLAETMKGSGSKTLYTQFDPQDKNSSAETERSSTTKEDNKSISATSNSTKIAGGYETDIYNGSIEEVITP